MFRFKVVICNHRTPYQFETMQCKKYTVGSFYKTIQLVRTLSLRYGIFLMWLNLRFQEFSFIVTGSLDHF